MSNTFEDLIFLCSAANTAEIFQYYSQHLNECSEYSILLGVDSPLPEVDSPKKQFFTPTKKFSGSTAKIVNLFGDKKILFVDKTTSNDFIHGKNSTFIPDYSISLDTQVVGYMCDYIFTRKENAGGVKDVFEYLIQKETQFDNLAYFLEETENLKYAPNPSDIYERLKGYEILRTVDVKEYYNNSRIVSLLSDAEINKKAQEVIVQMYENIKHTSAFTRVEKNNTLIYCQLLKGIIIQLKNPRKSLEFKLNEFYDFSLNQLALYDERMALLTASFFKKGKKPAFYDKVQISENVKFDTLIKTIKGMAWDVSHIRIALEYTATLKIEKNTDYFIPSFLSFDKRLTKVLDIYQLKAFIFSSSSGRYAPVYAMNKDKSLCADEKHKLDIYQKYFTTEAKTKRAAMRDNTFKNLSQIKEELEKEFKTLFPQP